MKKKYISYSIFFISILFYLLSVGYLYQKSIINGIFTYPLDDSYIHMAIAKNIAQHGVWGVSYDEFGSASSSPLFTVLLSISFYFFGVNIYTSIFINVIFSMLIIYIAWKFFENRLNNFLLALLLISIIIFTPLPNMTIVGMEHVMHAFFTLLYILVLWKIIIDKEKSRSIIYLYFIVCFLLPISRYEGLFMIIGGSFVLLCLKNVKLSILGGLVALLSVSIFGLYFISQGGTFLPYSLIIKTSLATENDGLFYKIFPLDLIIINYYDDDSLFRLLFSFISVLIYSFLVQQKGRRIYSVISAFSIGLLLQVLYSKFGWLDRYEAYIFPSILCVLFYSIYSLCVSINKRSIIKNIIYLSCFVLIIYPAYFFYIRVYYNTNRLLLASDDIYNQQYQTVRFINKYYPSESIGVNDVGYPSLISKGHVVDIFGLGNTNIALAKKNNGNVSYINKIRKEEIYKKNTKIIFIYKSWFLPEFYSSYEEIGSWKLKYNHVILGGDEVTVFSTIKDPIYIEQLKKSLREFSHDLPKGVEYIEKQ